MFVDLSIFNLGMYVSRAILTIAILQSPLLLRTLHFFVATARPRSPQLVSLVVASGYHFVHDCQ